MPEHENPFLFADEGPRWPNLKPKDAASLILIRRSKRTIRVLMGERHQKHTFLPGRFVFPGGGLDVGDLRVVIPTDLRPEIRSKVAAGSSRERHAAWRWRRCGRPSRRRDTSWASGKPPAPVRAQRHGGDSSHTGSSRNSTRSISSPAPSPRRAVRGASMPGHTKACAGADDLGGHFLASEVVFGINGICQPSFITLAAQTL